LRIISGQQQEVTEKGVKLMKFVLEINSTSYRLEIHEDIKNNLRANIFIDLISEKRIKYMNILKI
jgi:hypothetical protein